MTLPVFQGAQFKYVLLMQVMQVLWNFLANVFHNDDLILYATSKQNWYPLGTHDVSGVALLSPSHGRAHFFLELGMPVPEELSHLTHGLLVAFCSDSIFLCYLLRPYLFSGVLSCTNVLIVMQVLRNDLGDV